MSLLEAAVLFPNTRHRLPQFPITARRVEYPSHGGGVFDTNELLQYGCRWFPDRISLPEVPLCSGPIRVSGAVPTWPRSLEASQIDWLPRPLKTHNERPTPTMNPLKPEITRSAGTAVHVGALCMAVIVFATMWDSDARPEHSNHRLARRAEQRSRIVERGGIGYARISAHKSHDRLISHREMLPEGIVPGQYLVADTRGHVRHVRVTESMASSTSRERDQYLTKLDQEADN